MANLLSTTPQLDSPPGGGPTAIRYPSALGYAPFEKWMLFEVKAGRHVTRTGVVGEANSTNSTIKSVALYLPHDALKSELSVTWNTSEGYGPVGGAILQKALQSQKEPGPASTNVAGYGAIPNLLGRVAETVTEGAVTAFVNREITGATGTIDRIGNLLGGADSVKSMNVLEGLIGATVNPRTDLFFQAVNYRQHAFTFTLVPRNIAEAKAIDEILNTFQYYMLPSFGGENDADSYFIGYPYEFEITMFTQASSTGSFHHINTIDRSVLETVTIDHASNDRVAFVDEYGGSQYYPASTTLTLSFREVRLQGRDKQKAIWRGTNQRNPNSLDLPADDTRQPYPDPRGGSGWDEKIASTVGTGLEEILKKVKGSN